MWHLISCDISLTFFLHREQIWVASGDNRSISEKLRDLPDSKENIRSCTSPAASASEFMDYIFDKIWSGGSLQMLTESC